jgi:hypothetical protein
MRTLISIAALLAACGASKAGGAGPGEPDRVKPAPPPTRLLHLALEYVVLDPDEEPPTSRVSLIVTDETGSARREIIGEFTGGCSDVSLRARGEKLAPIMGLDCWWAGAGVKLRVVERRGVLNVMRAEVDEGSDDVSFEPLKSIELPPGTAVKTDYDDAEPGGPPGAS